MVQAIDAVNMAVQYTPTSHLPTSHAMFFPTALHHALSDFTNPDDKAAPHARMRVLTLLLEAGASPLGGAPRSSALAFALAVGVQTAATDLLLAHAPCGQLEHAMLPLADFKEGSASAELAGTGTGIVHAASRSQIHLVSHCRSLLRAAGTTRVAGPLLHGVTVADYPDLARAQACDRAGVYKDMFHGHARAVTSVVRKLEACGIKGRAAFNEADRANTPPPLHSTVMGNDAETAKALMLGGADPYFEFMQHSKTLGDSVTTGLHMAAHNGCDDIVEHMLEAAAAKAMPAMARLVAAKDTFGQLPIDVCFTDKARCLLAAAGRGVPPAEADCPGEASSWDITIRGAGGDQTCDAPGGEGCGASAGASSRPATGAPGGPGGWHRHAGTPPLLRDIGPARCDITEFQGSITSDEFLHTVRSRRRPAIFRGAAANWAAFSTWTKEYLVATAGNASVDSVPIPYSSLDGNGVAPERMSFADFIQKNESGPRRNPPSYVFDKSLLIEYQELLDDLEWPPMFENFTTHGPQQFIVGPEASGAPMHFHVEAFNAAIIGRKRWFFLPPAYTFWSHKPVSTWFGSDYAKVPDPLFQCVQGPGDIIYVPEAYGHAVLNVEDSVAVASEIKIM